MINNNPTISVIVPVYNVEKYLRRCIDSILAQTFTDFELLLIDDGSKDKSGEICDEYAKKDVRVKVFHKENGGVSSARNIGLDNAKGELICFSDSDDYVGEDWLSEFVKNSGCADLVVESFYEVTESNTQLVKMNAIQGTKDSILYLYELNVLGYLWCKCFKRSIISKHNLRFNPNYRIWEDTDFILRYACFCKSIACIPFGAYYYYIPDWVKYEQFNKYDCCISILHSIYRIFKDDRKASLMYKAYEDSLCRSLKYYYQRGNTKEGYKRMKKCKELISLYGDHTGKMYSRMIMKNPY